MMRRLANLWRIIWSKREPEPVVMREPVPLLDRMDILRDEYEAIPRGPKNKRRKRNSVRDLAAKYQMTTTEVMAAVRRQ